MLVLAALLLLSALSVYLYFSKSKFSSVDKDERAFSFKDTAAITRIFIADKDNHHSDIKRTEKGWIVNDKFNCRADAILNLLEVIKHVDVKMPVSKAGRENVIKFMSFNALKVEIYVGDDKVKQYYVGHETEDGEGSYMILSEPDSDKNFENPFICFIPGFKGYLAPRYIADENDWRDRIVVNYIPPEMKQIEVETNGAPKDSSFQITLVDANTFTLKDLNKQSVPFEEAQLRQFLVYFQNLSYEKLITGRNKRLTDSLSMQAPFQSIRITRVDGKKEEFNFYRKKYEGGASTNGDPVFPYDPDRFYLNFDGGRQWALCQYYVFGKLCVNTGYFVNSETVKK